MVFADWLLETGQGTHAELIRVQCALARAKTLARLDKVTLYRIGQARGAKALERASWLASIRWFRLHKQAVTETALAGLRQRLGDRFQLYPIAT